MKRLLSMIAISIMAVALSACSNTSQQNPSPEQNEQSSSSSERTTVENQTVVLNLNIGKMEGTYTGETLNGVPDGKGKFTSTNAYQKGWYYEGDFKDGHFHGTGITVWDSGQKQEGTYADDIWIPDVEQFYHFLTTITDANFSISEKAWKMLQEHPEYFPVKEQNSAPKAEESFDYATVTKKVEEYGDQFFTLNNLKVFSVSTFAVTENPKNMDELRCTYLVLTDEKDNTYEVYYRGDIDDYEKGDTVEQITALPLGHGEYVNRNHVQTIVFAASAISRTE